MVNFEKPPLPGESREKEQTQEEMKQILERAAETGAHVNLITKNEGLVPNLIVEEVGPDYAYFTYNNSEGNLGEAIHLNFTQIVKAELR